MFTRDRSLEYRHFCCRATFDDKHQNSRKAGLTVIIYNTYNTSFIPMKCLLQKLWNDVSIKNVTKKSVTAWGGSNKNYRKAEFHSTGVHICHDFFTDGLVEGWGIGRGNVKHISAGKQRVSWSFFLNYPGMFLCAVNGSVNILEYSQ